jgi:hypothetical protein
MIEMSRLGFAALDMTRTVCLTLILTAGVVCAQDAGNSSPPLASPSPTPVRSVRISFVPPPLEGTISLGIFDENDQLVRVLHQEASLDEFTVGPDALVTKWDGKDDFGYDLWPGTYHARGYLVAPIRVQEITPIVDGAPTSSSPPPQQPVKIRLMANPLEKNERSTIQIIVGIDDEDILLKTADGLPLFTIAAAGNATRVSLIPGESSSATLLVDTPAGARRFTVTGLNRMMAFNCGEIELK